MDKNIKVILADDHGYVLKSISTLLNKTPSIDVVAVAEDGEKALASARAVPADVIILDVDMPAMNGLQVSSHLQSAEIDVKIVILSIYDEPAIVRAAFKLGARGYVLKYRAASDLVKAIHVVNEGGIYISDPVGEYVSNN